jgi:hypothetical protein
MTAILRPPFFSALRNANAKVLDLQREVSQRHSVRQISVLIGEKLFRFVMAAEPDSEFAAELPAFVAAIQRLFPAEEIREYLDHLENTKFLAPPEPEIEERDEDEPWPANPVLGAAELLRFSRIRQLLRSW